jgi:hypothetical protein
MKPRLHLLGIPHTQTTDQFSHCAFTGKVKKFSPMMRSVGYEVIHYGVEGADSGANTQIDVLSLDEWNEIRNKLLLQLHPEQDVTDKTKYIGDLANVGNELYTEFNDRLRYLLRKNVEATDIICLPFGFAHQAALEGLNYGIKVETGIGYPNSYEKYRIFETHAWYHAEAGRQGVSGNDYWWVIPNYFISELFDTKYGFGDMHAECVEFTDKFVSELENARLIESIDEFWTWTGQPVQWFYDRPIVVHPCSHEKPSRAEYLSIMKLRAKTAKRIPRQIRGTLKRRKH